MKKQHQCELTGKLFEGEPVEVLVEGVMLKVAPENANFGKKVPKPAAMPRMRTARKFVEPTFTLCKNFGRKIKQRREQMGMRHTDLARFLNERESLIHQIESEHFKPPQKLTKKIEAKLGIKLEAQASSDEEVEIPMHEESGPLTLGDFIKK